MRARHVLGGLAAAATIALPAAPAAAAATSALERLSCAQPASVFAPATTGTARGGEREKDTRWAVPDSEIPRGEAPATSSSFSATVPVWFHVIAASRSPREGWVSDDQIREQIAVLNRAFAGGYGGADTGFRFRLEGVTRTIDREWFEMETFAAELEAKSALKRGGATTLNVYSNSGGGFLGWAYYPKIVAYRQYEVLDGIVIHFDSMPGGKIRNFNLGHTATHEAGHWLGLPHTFEQGCAGHGDYVDDTPAEATPTSGCPIGKDTCPEPGADPIHNYMDYSWDSCYREFTPGQAQREQQQYLHWRVQHG